MKKGRSEPPLNANPRDEQEQGGESDDQVGGAAARGEGDDEAEQIEGERKHPQHRHGDDVGGEMGRRRQHQPRRHRRQGNPVEQPAPGRGGPSCLRRGLNRGRRDGQRAGRDHQHEQRIAGRPEQALLLQGEQRLDQQRIGEKAGEAAQVGRGVERIGIASGALERVPALHQRRLRRDDEEERPDRRGEKPGRPQGRHPVRGQGRRADPDRQPKGGECEQSQMHPGLPPRTKPGEEVGVGIAGEEQALIDQHRAVPHRGRSAEPRQRHPGDHRLGQEKQERSGKNGDEEKRPGESFARPGTDLGLALSHRASSLAASGA